MHTTRQEPRSLEQFLDTIYVTIPSAMEILYRWTSFQRCASLTPIMHLFFNAHFRYRYFKHHVPSVCSSKAS